MTEPFIKASPGKPILAVDWNQMQVQLIELIGQQIASHTHVGGVQGTKLVGTGIDGAAKLSVAEVVASAKLAVNGVDVFERLMSLGTGVTGLQSSVGTLQTNVGTLQTNVGALQTKVGTAQTDIGTLKTNVGTLQTDVGALKTNVTTLQSNVTGLSSNVGTLQSNVTGLSSNVGTLQTDVGALKTNVTTLQSNVGSLQLTVNSLNGGLNTLNSSVSGLQTSVTNLSNNKLDKSGGTITGSLSVTASLSVEGIDVAKLLKVHDAELLSLLQQKLSTSGGTINGSLTVSTSLTVAGHDVAKELGAQQTSINNLNSQITGKLDKSGGTVSGSLNVSTEIKVQNGALSLGAYAFQLDGTALTLDVVNRQDALRISEDGFLRIGNFVGDDDVPLDVVGGVKIRPNPFGGESGLLFAEQLDQNDSKHYMTTRIMANHLHLTIEGHVNEMGDLTTSWNEIFDLSLWNGDLQIAGRLWEGSSDASLKMNVAPLEGALDKLLRLRGVTFEWKEPQKVRRSAGAQIGLIAQEVEPFFPEWVGEDRDGYKTLTIGDFEALTIEALRELQNQIRALRGEPALPHPKPAPMPEGKGAAPRTPRRHRADLSEREVIATYDYTDEQGNLLFQRLRYVPKMFGARRPDGKGGWLDGMGNTRLVLYRLPQVVRAENVLICEGEKDTETAERLGLPDSTWAATTNPGPAAWCTQYSNRLRGKRVVICPDADFGGMRHFRRVVRDLEGKAADIRWIELPPGKDLTEWVEAGGTSAELLEMIRNAKPIRAADLDKVPDYRYRK